MVHSHHSAEHTNRSASTDNCSECLPTVRRRLFESTPPTNARTLQTFNYIFLGWLASNSELFLNDRHARITAKAAGWACVVCARVWKILLLILIIAYKQWWCWWILTAVTSFHRRRSPSIVMLTLSVPHGRARSRVLFVCCFFSSPSTSWAPFEFE